MQVTLSMKEWNDIQRSAEEKAVELSNLRKEVELLKSQTDIQSTVQPDSKYLILNLDKVCQVLGDLKGKPYLLSALFLGIIKMKPEGMTTNVLHRMEEACSLTGLPIIINGNYNDIHDCDNVDIDTPHP